ncbi:MAG: hypothetical protein IJ512_08165 [Ruminococcus sp.]|nr:hypothetical protein [Ruminococcus sp.]
MILLMDNYDPCMRDMYKALSELDGDICVVRCDEMTAEAVRQFCPQAIVISSGTGTPEDTGVCMEVIRHFAGKVPILGIGLGGLTVAACFGGVQKKILSDETAPFHIGFAVQSRLFAGMKPVIGCKEPYAYTVQEDTLPECLRVTARDQFGQLAALEHTEHKTYALCFRPEALMQDAGKKILENLIQMISKKEREEF